MRSQSRLGPISLQLPSKEEGIRTPMRAGVPSAKRCTDCPSVRLRLSVPLAETRHLQAIPAHRNGVRSVGRGIGLVRSAVLLMILLHPAVGHTTDWSKFLPPVRSGLGPTRIGCAIYGPGLQFTGKEVSCGWVQTGGRFLMQMCQEQRKAWDVHLWGDYLVYDTTPEGIRRVQVRRTGKRWYARRWSEKKAYQDCRRFSESWKKHLRQRQVK